MLISKYDIEMFSPPCDPGSPIWVAVIKTDADLGQVMPYVNAAVKNGFYEPKAPALVWGDGAYKYSLRDDVINVKPLKDRRHAERIAQKAVDFINGIWEKRREITPDHTTRIRPKLLDILRFLPRTNCGKCGMASCMAFAAQVVEGEKDIEDCPPLFEEAAEEKLEGLRSLGL
jgi:ArsR family metal-binding transcriptional regulator